MYTNFNTGSDLALADILNHQLKYCSEAKTQENGNRRESLCFSMVGLPREPLLEMLGEYYLTFLQKRGFGEILKNLGHNVLEFLQNLDSVHALIKRDYPDMVAPSFRCDADSSSDKMVLHYYSHRKGLYPVIKGNSVIR